MPSHLYRCGTRFQWTFSSICMALPARGICCCSRELLVKGGFLRNHFSPPRVPGEEIGLVLCRVDDASEWIPRSNGQVLPVCLRDCHPHSLLPLRPGAHSPPPSLGVLHVYAAQSTASPPGGPRSSSPGRGKESYESEMTYKDKYFIPVIAESEQSHNESRKLSVTRNKIMTAQYECYQKIIQDPIQHTEGLYCNRTWDGWLCWSYGLAGTESVQHCPDYFQDFDPSEKVTKICDQDGHWFRHPDSNRTWTDYTRCNTNTHERLQVGRPGVRGIGSAPTATQRYRKAGWRKASRHPASGKPVRHALEKSSRKTICRNNTVEPAWPRGRRSAGDERRGKKRDGNFSDERESWIGCLLHAPHWDQARNPGLCPDQELNLTSWSLSCQRITLHKNLFFSFVCNSVITIIHLTAVANNQALVATDPVGCKVSQFLHLYLMGCNYFWMLCEGVYLHTLIVVAVFAEKQRLLWYHVLGWGFPLIPACTHAVGRSLYYNDKCWISSDTHLLYIIHGPICAALLVACSVFPLQGLLVSTIFCFFNGETPGEAQGVEGEVSHWSSLTQSEEKHTSVVCSVKTKVTVVQAILRRNWNQYKIQFGSSFSHSDALRSASYTVSTISDGTAYSHDFSSEHSNGKSIENVILKPEKLNDYILP
ncbi:Calcitonin related peptide type 1 receptor [Myotis davidii]|uniref:Calcitonin gene-related peptide type 1 receptor n=1 Tax=Myotis davidii TaxID=225400 RepID=L5LQC9_MYODS|nr:Calcitonin related peptide type 1 receptor [Myotis davidii]